MNDLTWAGIVTGFLALAGTIVNSYFARQDRRDKMEFDEKAKNQETEIILLKAKVEDQGSDIKRCEEDKTELRIDVKKCREEHEAAQRQREQMEKRISALEHKVDPSSH